MSSKALVPKQPNHAVVKKSHKNEKKAEKDLEAQAMDLISTALPFTKALPSPTALLDKAASAVKSAVAPNPSFSKTHTPKPPLQEFKHEAHLEDVPAGQFVQFKTSFEPFKGKPRTANLQGMYSRYRKMGPPNAWIASEKLTALSGSTVGLQAGETLYQLDLNPGSWPYGSRLRAEATKFTRFFISDIRFIYSPLVGTNTNGGFAISYFPDPHTLIQLSGNGSEFQMEQASPKNTTECPFWASNSLRPDLMVPVDPFYTNTSSSMDAALTSQGLFMVKTVGGFTGNVAIGSIIVQYVVHFFGPKPSIPVFNSGATLGTADVTDDNGTGNGIVGIYNFTNFPTITPTNSASYDVLYLVRFRLIDAAVFQDASVTENILMGKSQWYYTKVRTRNGVIAANTSYPDATYKRVYASYQSCITDTQVIIGHPATKTHTVEWELIDADITELIVIDTPVAGLSVSNRFSKCPQGHFVETSDSCANREQITAFHGRFNALEQQCKRFESMLQSMLLKAPAPPVSYYPQT